MAKTYIDFVKYVIEAKFEINGEVEKPDIIGAIFGQTEGLLGDDLDYRELQKNGRIGRIEVEMNERGGHTVGKIIIPSSLDIVETTILAAALETVNRVGPCEAKIEVEKVEDTRAAKRKFIIDMAKEILRHVIKEEMPDSQEITDLVKAEAKKAEIIEYGPDKLPAGPGIEESEDIIIVEGRADVLNLLKYGINNAIAVGGAKAPKTVMDLTKRKETTLFLDGDRGGDIILKTLLKKAEVDYVARAPKGREVEELTRKEIIKALRSKVPVEVTKDIKESPKRELKSKRENHTKQEQEIMDAKYEPLIDALKKLRGTFKAKFFDKKHNEISELPIRELFDEKNIPENATSVVFDGIVTQRVVTFLGNHGIDTIIGIKKGDIKQMPKGVKIFSLEG